MLADSDAEWLAIVHPGLIPNADGTQVEGTIDFTGSYDVQTDQFTLVVPDDPIQLVGLVLSASYSISIKKSVNPVALPKFYVHDGAIRHDATRHFFRDESACVCGVSEEARFVADGFNFKRYIEEYAIPFLYGQTYYDKHGKWPWPEYAHDTAGILESYLANGSIELLSPTLQRLQAMIDWKQVKSILLCRNRPKGHIRCFCATHDLVRRCHPEAWRGLMKLHADLRQAHLTLS